MKYEIVELKEKKITGLAARTSNDDPKMGEIIGNLWTRLFQDNLYDKIQDKVSPYTYCLYSDYDEKGYQATEESFKNIGANNHCAWDDNLRSFKTFQRFVAFNHCVDKCQPTSFSTHRTFSNSGKI